MKHQKFTKVWTKVKWHGNTDEPYASWECWQLGGYILHPGQWQEEGWSFCASYGANSDRSYSGFLKGITDLELAKREIEKIKRNEDSQ